MLAEPVCRFAPLSGPGTPTPVIIFSDGYARQYEAEHKLTHPWAFARRSVETTRQPRALSIWLDIPSRLAVPLERGDDDEQPYLDFATAFHNAEVELESPLVERFKAAGGEDWRATERFLSKRFPHRWSDAAGRRAVDGTAEAAVGQMFHITLIGINGSELPDPQLAARQPAVETTSAPVLPPKDDPDSKLN